MKVSLLSHFGSLWKSASKGRHTTRIKNRNSPAGSLALAVLVLGFASETGYSGDPGELFVKTCAPCHSKDGKAQTPAARKLGVKDLSLSKLTDSEIAEQIREGKQPNQSQSKMPAFKEKLTSEEIQSLVEVVKQFRK